METYSRWKQQRGKHRAQPWRNKLVLALISTLALSTLVTVTTFRGTNVVVSSGQDEGQSKLPDAALQRTDELQDGSHMNHSMVDVEGAVSYSTKIHFITVQTGASPTWCRMLLSAALTDPSITVVNLAWGAKYAHIKRPQWIFQYLSTLPSANVVLFADGGDTIYTGVRASSVLSRFVEATAATPEEFSQQEVALGHKLSPVLFNAEANCYHQQTFQGSWGVKKGKCLSAYKRYDPNITSKYRFLNGGGWIARVWAARIVFQAAIDIIRKDSHWWCDQSVFGGLLLSGELRGILGLDTNNKFFLPTYHLRPLRDFCPLSANSRTAPEGLRMCHSSEIPAVLHFNGKSEGKFTADVMVRTGWSSTLRVHDKAAVLAEVRSNSTILASGAALKVVRIGDVCPALTLPI